MELWSKGLGKRVLSLALGERSKVTEIDGDLAIAGTMHAPTYWDYSVDLDGQDIVEFIGLLEDPETVRFVAADESLLRFVGTAVASSAVFLARTLRMVAFGAPEAATDVVALDDSDWPEEGEIDDGMDDGIDDACGDDPGEGDLVTASLADGARDGRS